MPAEFPGSNPTNAASLPKHNITFEGRKAWRRELNWPQSCEESFTPPDEKSGGITFHLLSGKRYLVRIVCTTGAYQGYQLYYSYDEGVVPAASKPLTFMSYEATGESGTKLTRVETTEVWGLSEFDAKTRQLSVLNKFRGPGDCGIYATYAFDKGDVQLREFRAKPACDGRSASQPEQWPRLKLR